MKIRLLYLLAPLFLLLSANGGPHLQNNPNDINADDERAQIWVDSVFQSLSPDERLGQFFMIRAHSDLGSDHIQNVKRQIQKYKVGGLCFFQGTPEKHA
ncbi:MAG: hypothetical protein AAGJ18_31180, partial [Bacteroidota bacterium]